MKKKQTSKPKATPNKQPVLKTPQRHVDDEITDSFINEVTEDVKNDQLKVFWNRYGLFIILFVVLAVSATVGFETLKNWRNSKHAAATENYMVVVQTPDLQEAKTSLEKIAENDNGIYGELARIQIANVLFEQNKADEATSVLEEIIKDSDLDERIRSLATLKLAAYKLDTTPYAEIQAMLAPVITANNSWTPLAQDLLAMSAIQNGDISTARQIYTELLQAGNLSENFRARIQDMLSALSDM